MAIDCVSKHTAFIMDRGGTQRMFPVKSMAEVRWNRVRDDISEANIKIQAARCFEQEETLSKIEPHRHELVLYRGQKRVWEGPITRIGMDASQMEIHANDVMHYVSRTLAESGYNNAYPNTAFAIDRIHAILENEMLRKEAAEFAAFPDLPSYNILDHVVYHQTGTDARTSRSMPAMNKTVWEEIDDMAAKGGIDYTVVGRAIHFWDTSKPLGYTRTATQADFDSRIKATIYGMDLATKAVVTDGEGNWGEAYAADTVDGVHPFYGMVENLETAYDETEGAAPPTSAEMESQAARNIVGRSPAPVVLRVPDNSGISLGGIFTMENLVPGTFVPLRAKILIRTFNQTQKLDKVSVTETPTSEKIAVVMSPSTTPDDVEP